MDIQDEEALTNISQENDFDRIQKLQQPANRNLMHTAVLNEDIAVLRYLLNVNKSLVNQSDSEGHTPLSLAIREEKYYCAKIMVFSNCNLNIGGGPIGSNLSLAVLKF